MEGGVRQRSNSDVGGSQRGKNLFAPKKIIQLLYIVNLAVAFIHILVKDLHKLIHYSLFIKVLFI